MSIRGEASEKKKKNSTHVVLNIPTKLGIYSFLSTLKTELMKHNPEQQEKWTNYIRIIESLVFDKIIPTLFPSITKPRENTLLENNASVAFLYYLSNRNKGLKQHFDTSYHHSGPVSLISFTNSILDYIPFQELRDIGYNPLRLVYNSGSLVTMDGTPRYYYTHGVPQTIKFEKSIRCAIVVRFDDVGIRGKNCQHGELFEGLHHPCVSNMN